MIRDVVAPELHQCARSAAFIHSPVASYGCHTASVANTCKSSNSSSCSLVAVMFVITATTILIIIITVWC